MLLAVLALLPPSQGGAEPKARPFELGVSLIPHDDSDDGIRALGDFIRDHAEWVVRKVDGGVPWPEALDGKPYPRGFDESLAEGAELLKGKKVLLLLSPLNEGLERLADYPGEEDERRLPEAWAGKDLDDPMVLRAYAAHCREMIRRFRPSALAYATEVNGLVREPARWKKFLVFARNVYALLKKEHPELVSFFTLNLEVYAETESVQKAALLQALPFSDWTGVHAAPGIQNPNPAKIPRDYFARVAVLAPRKPLAVVGTGFLAEDVRIENREWVGKAAWQDEYLRMLLTEATRLRAKLVVWSVPRDFDLLYAKEADGDEDGIVRLLRDSGLIDGEGRPRPSMETWKRWLSVPVR